MSSARLIVLALLAASANSLRISSSASRRAALWQGAAATLTFAGAMPAFADRKPGEGVPLPIALAEIAVGDSVKAAEERATAEKASKAQNEALKEAKAERLEAAKAKAKEESAKKAAAKEAKAKAKAEAIAAAASKTK